MIIQRKKTFLYNIFYQPSSLEGQHFQQHNHHMKVTILHVLKYEGETEQKIKEARCINSFDFSYFLLHKFSLIKIFNEISKSIKISIYLQLTFSSYINTFKQH